MDAETIRWLIGGVFAAVAFGASTWISIWEADRRRKRDENRKKTESVVASTNNRRDIKELQEQVDYLKKNAVTVTDLGRLEEKVQANADRTDKHLRKIYSMVKNLPVTSDRLTTTMADVEILSRRVHRLELQNARNHNNPHNNPHSDEAEGSGVIG